MRFFSLVLTFLLSTPSLTSAADTPASRPRGVPKSRASLYLPSPDDTFTCLDKSKTIPFSRVNDDYCDCPDGSDEPGTSACENGKFHCMNRGHVPAWLSSSRVGDGICDYDLCCDGSDEEWRFPGLCPDLCAEIGKTAREAEREKRRINAQGWAEREKLVREAARKRAEVDHKLQETRAKLTAARDTESRLKQNLDEILAREATIAKRVGTGGAAAVAQKARERIARYRDAIHSLRADLDIQRERTEILEGILEDLAKGYNPNNQDMAVKAAVVGWSELKTAPILAPPPSKGEMSQAEIRDLLEEEDDLGDVIELLEMHQVEETLSLLWKIGAYLPEPVTQYLTVAYHSIRATLHEYGIIPLSSSPSSSGSTSDAATSKAAAEARAAHTSASQQTRDLSAQLDRAQSDLDTDFGPDGVWRALKGVKIEAVVGGYTYEVTLLEKATQISKRDGGRSSLGTFSGFEGGDDDKVVLVYDRGAKCWNGPERSMKIYVECGAEMEVLGVVEPEKCEYAMRVRGPVVCVKPSERSGNGKGEKVEVGVDERGWLVPGRDEL
ncbi:hypothetical protein YB2330_001307 [Saitoella coloradoensis]